MKKECPICHKLTEERGMIWLKGLNRCRECVAQTDEEAYIKVALAEIDNFINEAVKPLDMKARERVFKVLIERVKEKANETV